jgi:phosphoglycolate phosphatase-like HAD superfamily hydrolase
VWFVGDSIDDMVCGKLAGCRTCLLLTDENQKVKDSEYVDIVVKSLSEFGRHIGLDI